LRFLFEIEALFVRIHTNRWPAFGRICVSLLGVISVIPRLDGQAVAKKFDGTWNEITI